METPEILNKLARDVGGTIEKVSGPLPDGSGFATMSWPLPKDHWIYGIQDAGFSGEPPARFRMGQGDLRNVLADIIREAGKYAVKASTMCGKEIDFDPDAMVQNLVVAFLGFWTEDGFSHCD